MWKVKTRGGLGALAAGAVLTLALVLPAGSSLGSPPNFFDSPDRPDGRSADRGTADGRGAVGDLWRALPRIGVFLERFRDFLNPTNLGPEDGPEEPDTTRGSAINPNGSTL